MWEKHNFIQNLTIHSSVKQPLQYSDLVSTFLNKNDLERTWNFEYKQNKEGKCLKAQNCPPPNFPLVYFNFFPF